MKTIFLSLFVVLLSTIKPYYSQVTATSSIDVATPIMSESRLLFGITMDSRTGMTGTNGQVGYFNPDGTLIPEVDPLFSDFPVTSLRYPGNGIGTGFDWKKSIGLPTSSRPIQDLLGNAGAAQAVEFGFDEFMAWTVAKGVSPADVHIMVSIYDSATTWPDQIQQGQALPNIVQHCADWVEYANAPNDGSNPGGGTDWAAIRAANGHPNPYGIKLWNMGNEPWASHEFTSSVSGCNQYLSLIPPIIDAMLAIDPSIKITLATVGANVGPNSWHYTILNSSLVASGKIYGLSPHAFPVESGSTTKVSNFVSIYTSLASNCQAKGLKMILGDYAQGIPQNPATQAEKDIAMQWEGTILGMDFLLGMSKINNLERVNFWVYGMPSAVWHPIRLLNGVYTLMPVAQMYKTMFPLVLDHSIATTNTSNGGSDGNPYGVNTSAFASSDQSMVNLISVNRDLNDTHELQVSALAGYNLFQARLLTATSVSSETINETPILPNASGNYIIPPMSILILEYAIAPPQASITNLSQTSLCQDQTLTITGVNLSNISSVSIGGTIVNFSSISSTTIDVTFNTTASGQIQIVSSGQTITSVQNVTVYALPESTITASSNTTFCQGQSVDLSSNASTGNVWNGGSTNQLLNVTSSGDYFVTITDGNGCTATSNSIQVIVNPLPDISISSDQTSISAVNSSASYQWFDCTNGLIILGENGQTFMPINSGDYGVIVNENNCSDTSLCVNFTNLNAGVNSLIDNKFIIYPNPVNDNLYFNKEIQDYKILNSFGKEIKKGSGNVVSVNTLCAGIYFLETNVEVIKFEVIK